MFNQWRLLTHESLAQIVERNHGIRTQSMQQIKLFICISQTKVGEWKKLFYKKQYFFVICTVVNGNNYFWLMGFFHCFLLFLISKKFKRSWWLRTGNVARTCRLINFWAVNFQFFLFYFLVFSCVNVSENPPGGSYNGATTIKRAYFGEK